MSLENGRVTTEPLAGTRSCGSSDAERLKLRQELLSDSKEIVEHVLSVKAAVEELEQICSNDSVVVDDFMSIRERGKVQHLGSRVCGQLNEAKDAWDAFDVLFPSITASGIPKQPALEVITSLETRPRELYSGSVIMLEGSDFFEGALVLRSVYQDEEKAWVQAGAGIIDQSEPTREFTETVEKLSTIAPFVVPL
ncbi:Salicylate synthase like protein [Verticillium longisporum]|nr:Salicylate synthase like protein [Verticillium longisporum]KAG7124984.1 Salicylate synthase like protein [Verticillium longisporum]KAG7135037.1 Salicylate synthase like protein [Verticillium longisporum]